MKVLIFDPLPLQLLNSFSLCLLSLVYHEMFENKYCKSLGTTRKMFSNVNNNLTVVFQSKINLNEKITDSQQLIVFFKWFCFVTGFTALRFF